MTLSEFLDGKSAVDVMHDVRIKLLENGKFKTLYEDGTNIGYTLDSLMALIIKNTNKHPELINELGKYFPEVLVWP